jgi:hypothetical protein
MQLPSKQTAENFIQFRSKTVARSMKHFGLDTFLQKPHRPFSITDFLNAAFQ